MRVFVANPTFQNRDLYYRMPGVQTTAIVHIPAGSQIQLPHDVTGNALKSIVDQLEALGAVPKDDIRAIIYPKSLLYSVTASPITADAIEAGLERDEMARQEVAAEKLEEAGFQAFGLTQRAVASAGRGRVVETAMEIREVTDRGPVKDSVNAEFVVSTKPGRRAGKKREEAKA